MQNCRIAHSSNIVTKSHSLIVGHISETLDGSISVVNVPIVTPNCDVVVPSLTLKVSPGQHILITGKFSCDVDFLFKCAVVM